MITNCLSNSGLLKLHPDVHVANYENAHKGGLSLLLPFPPQLKTGKVKSVEAASKEQPHMLEMKTFQN